MTKTTLFEHTKPPVKRGSKWLVTVAVPGKGASGTYSAEVLENDGPAALPPGTKSWFSHDNQARNDPRNQVGTYEKGAFWNADEQELQAELTVKPHWNDVVDALGAEAEVSIRVAGDTDASGNVTRLYPARTNSVDLVGYAGLEGSTLKYQIESLVEAARNATIDKDTLAEQAEEMERNKAMAELEEVAKDVKSLSESFAAFVSEYNKEKQGIADAAAVDVAAKAMLAESVEKFQSAKTEIAEANLPKSQTEKLEALALSGEDISSALVEAKAIVEEVTKTLTESIGDVVVVGGEGKITQNFGVSGWSKR